MLAPELLSQRNGAPSRRALATPTGVSPFWTECPEMLRSLLSHCFSESDEPWPFIPLRVQALGLLSDSHLSSGEPVHRVDQATAMVGHGWLNALAFIQSLAQHIRGHIKSAETTENYLALQVFQETIFLANASEILARTTGSSNSLQSWLAGLILGGAQIGEVFNEQSNHLTGEANPVNIAKLGRFLSILNAPTELRLPAVWSVACGPWCTLRAAEQLARSTTRVVWAEPCLANVRAAKWPSAISTPLQRKISSLREPSMEFGRIIWDAAAPH